MSLSGAEAVRRSMMLSSGVTEKCVTRLRRICTIAGPWLLEVDHGREELRGLKRRGRGEDDDFGAHTKLTIVAAAQIRLSISLAALSNDAQGRQAPAGILHRPDQQRPHGGRRTRELPRHYVHFSPVLSLPSAKAVPPHPNRSGGALLQGAGITGPFAHVS